MASNWKKKVSQSKYLEEFYKNKPNPEHPIFGGEARRRWGRGDRCIECKKSKEASIWLYPKWKDAYCRKCYAKIRGEKTSGKNRF